tara:strand:+ start:1009 stop:2247 length:1239 start_codon:yes stop_codon:yes gene_type:complete
MAEKKEEPIVDNESGSIKVKEKTQNQPTGNQTKGNVTKVQTKMKQPVKDLSKETITKVDLREPNKPKENEVKKDNTDNEGMVAESKDANTSQEQKEIQSETETQETPTLEEVTEETKVEEVAEVAEEAIKESMETGKPLPENIQKLVDFMEETGGDLNDYVKLNQDYSKLDDQDLLYEYFKNTKPHLNAEEINFLMEDRFSYDEDTDDEKEIRRKKLALKEQVASAKTQLEENKSKYYEEIKAGSKLTTEQQKAIDFFNRYNKEEAENKKDNEKRVNKFQQETKNVFNDKFKGFEYNIGDKKFRYNVQDAEKIKNTQSDINNFIGKFLDKNNTMKDAKGYHKSLFTAMNPDAIAKHFYEQGQADAIKSSVEKGKNINMDPRQAHGEVETGGIKVRVLGDNTADFKFKIKNKN